MKVILIRGTDYDQNQNQLVLWDSGIKKINEATEIYLKKKEPDIQVKKEV